MTITVAILRAAGITAEQIVRVLELEHLERTNARREQNRINQRNHRLSKHVSADSADRADILPIKERLLDPEESLKKPTLVKGRGGRLPADWTPSAADVEFAREQVAEAWLLERDKFRDYWHSKPGAGATKVDWSATWRNWVRKAAETRVQPKRVNGYDPDRNTRYVPNPTFWDNLRRPKPP